MNGTTAAVLEGFFLWQLRTLLFLCITCVRITWACYPEHTNLDGSNPRIPWISKAPAHDSSGTVAAAAAAVQHQRTSPSVYDGVYHTHHTPKVLTVTSWFQIKRNIPPWRNKTMNTPKTTTQRISTWRRQQREHVGESRFGVRAVASEIWVLFVLLGNALLHRDLIGR